jgi:Tol biopolymer transport system component/predicted Ser/Thr protein kinase
MSASNLASKPMALSPGTRLGPYEIVAPVGAGGMGEVYKARDTRLDRVVAIKTSAVRFSDRFEREARAIAALNHPHICHLYDVGPDYLVMEYIDGTPVGGPLSVDKALRYATEILDALDDAHRHGIVHRDLKPANIFVTKAGIKLLDFGLAKMGAGAAATDDATRTAYLTGEHTILGTLEYMSPEQLQAKDADARSDIFSFGLVLYEMLTGKRAFSADSQASFIASVLKDTPVPPSAVAHQMRPTIPRALDDVVAACLAKDPDDRWQTVRDLKRELLRLGRETQLSPRSEPSHRRTAGEQMWMALTAVATIAAAVLLVAYTRKAPAPESPVRVTVLPPDEHATFTADANFGGTALSPDGRMIVFGAESDGKRHLYMRRLDSLESREIPGTEQGGKPFWSPDGRSIGFFVSTKLKRVDVAGGDPVTFGEGGPRGGSWSSAGTILFTYTISQGPGRGIQRISDQGGAATPVTTLNAGAAESAHYWPQFLPDEKHFLFLARSADREKTGIYVGSLDDAPEQSKRVRLVTTQYRAAYAPSPAGRGGYLLFVRGATLVAQRFDPATLELEGDAAPVAENVTLVSSNGFADFTVSLDGRLAYGSRMPPQSNLIWRDRSGQQGQPAAAAASYTALTRSPDGRSAAVGSITPTQGKDIFVLDFERGTRTPLTFGEFADDPVWSPDGREIAYDIITGGIFTRNANGLGAPQQKLDTAARATPISWCGDGKSLLYKTNSNRGKTDLWILPMGGDTKAYPYLQMNGNVDHGQFSPDCQWVAYDSDESGATQVYVQSFPAGKGKWQVSSQGGSRPAWREDGHELFFRHASNLMAVTIKVSGNIVAAGVPHALFEYAGASDPDVSFAAFDEGRRFLVPDPIKRPNTPLTLMLHWQDGLKKPRD